MYIKFLYGKPLVCHIYKFESSMTDKELINFGRLLLSREGYPDINAFEYKVIDEFENSLAGVVISSVLWYTIFHMAVVLWQHKIF